MEILGNPGVGAASAGGIAAVGVAWDPWAANIRPPHPSFRDARCWLQAVPRPRSPRIPVGPSPCHSDQIRSQPLWRLSVLRP